MLVSNSKTLRQVLEADLHLADMDESCWSAYVSKSFSGMRNEEVCEQSGGGYKEKESPGVSGHGRQPAGSSLVQSLSLS
eukprot:333113-Pelagomonas_calceolata.AAC.1